VDVLVARQAIFDRDRRVYGYELLFRSNAGLNEFDGTEAGLATKQVLANSLLVIGLENLVGTKKAFVNFGRGPLLQGWHAALPRESTVIELLETVEPDAEVLEACRKLREEGYQIALDDFVFRPGCEQLLDIADLVKIEIQSVPRPEQKLLVRSSKARGLQVLAEKVETHEEFEWARQVGYDYFQGYFFARPVMMRGRQIPTAMLH
jgi:c-di-GMP-related signal transduction protein